MTEGQRRVWRYVRRGLGLTTLALVTVAAWLATTPLPLPANSFETVRWIGPVAVVDVVAGTVAPDRAIRIEAGRIAAVVDARSLDGASRAAMADVGGGYAVPGLWDMHAGVLRYAPALDHPLNLAHGVTRMRSVLNCPAEGALSLHPCQSLKARWNAEVRAGRMMGPVVMGSGSYPIVGPERRHRDSPKAWAAATPRQARELVRLVARQRHRPDHLKAYDGLPRVSFLALMDEARRKGIEVSGHVPTTIRASEAAAAGFKAIAHARVLPISCSSQEAEIMRLRASGTPQLDWMRLALDSYDPAACERFWATLRTHGTFVSPTLVTRYNETLPGIEALAADPAIDRFTPAPVGLIWLEDTSAIEGRAAAEEAVFQRFYRAAAARTAEADRAGVRLLLGADSYDTRVLPGAGLHHEIELWRRAGIPPAAILRAATVNAAAYFGLGASHGQVAPGFAADIVITARNPLTELSTLGRPVAVMQEGRLYRRATLDAALARAAQTARSWRYTVHFLRDLLRNPLGFAG